MRDLDGMNDEAKQSMDPKRRVELFHRINRIVVDDAAAMPAVPADRPLRE
jgi:hypothetical protein